MDLEQEIWSEEKILTLLAIDKRKLKQLVKDKAFPIIKLGNRNVFLSESVFAWMKAQENISNAAPKSKKTRMGFTTK